MKNRKILSLVQAAMIAALYVVLTLIANMFGLASGNIQIRFSEALTILPFFTPAAIPGLYIGCLLSNVVAGCALPDIIFGPLATLLGALGTWALGKAARKAAVSATSGSVKGKADVGHSRSAKLFTVLSPLPPILANAVIIPPVLKYAYGITPIWFSIATVTIGEIISCGVFGLILLFSLDKYKAQLFGRN
ncbi:MAG: QueT transporter family protein [Lachnospiraceae bacterium]|nr:QueT transporter family protein [Lachnospiraceae bacterium]